MKINPKLIPLAYKLSKDVHNKTISHSDAVNIFSKDGQMNAGSSKTLSGQFQIYASGEEIQHDA